MAWPDIAIGIHAAGRCALVYQVASSEELREFSDFKLLNFPQVWRTKHLPPTIDQMKLRHKHRSSGGE